MRLGGRRRRRAVRRRGQSPGAGATGAEGARSRTSRPSRRTARRWPGRSMTLAPPVGEQCVDGQDGARGDTLGGAGFRGQDGVAEHAPAQLPGAGRKQPAPPRQACPPVGDDRSDTSAADPSSRPMSSRSWSACAGQGGGDAGASSRSSSGSTRPARACAPGCTRGSASCGSSQARRPRPGRRRGSSRRTSRTGARRREPAAHPGQRAPARTAREPEQHRLGLVVQGVAEQHGAGGGRAATASSTA